MTETSTMGRRVLGIVTMLAFGVCLSGVAHVVAFERLLARPEVEATVTA